MASLWRSGDQRRKEVVVSGLAGPGPDLIDGRVDLSDGGDVALSSLGAQRLADLTERTMDRPKPGGYVAPGILGVGRHQVEDGPDFLCLAADHTHP